MAANFRREVTSTAIWLLGHNVRLQCFKVTPFERDGEIFLNVGQIIPTPEVASYMIGLAEKETSMQSDEVGVRQRQQLRLAFWSQALAAVRASPCRLFANVNPSERAKASAGAGIGAVWYEMVFLYDQARVQLYFDRPNAEENKKMFDRLKVQRSQIEKHFGDVLVWNRMDGRIGAQVQYAKEFNGRDEDQWPAMIAWIVKYVGKLEAALRGPLLEIRH